MYLNCVYVYVGPIQKLLEDKEEEINEHVYQYANARMKLLIKYLSEVEAKEKAVYIENMQRVTQLGQ